MNAHKTFRVSRLPLRCYAFALRGYLDGEAGVPAPKAYDGWDLLDQRNYENARFCAVIFKAAGRPVPAFHADLWATSEYRAAQDSLPNPHLPTVPRLAKPKEPTVLEQLMELV